MNINKLFNKLGKSIIYLEVVIYLIVFLLISRALLIMIVEFFSDEDLNKWYLNTKLNFGYTISISLTTIVFLEILKLFFIKTTHQILIVSGIIVLKLIINYFISDDLKKENIN